jgi:hypothetical protein
MWRLILAGINLLTKVLGSRIGGWIVTALLWLGISLTTYKFGVDGFKSLISGEFSHADFLVNWIGFFGIDQAITIVLSAIASKYAVQGAKIALTKKG